jgi:hypothetical protein
MIEIDMEAFTPIFLRYSMWIGETARSIESERSSGRPFSSSCGTIGTGSASTLVMTRRRLRL